MEIVITGKDITLTPSIKSYVAAHAGKLSSIHGAVEMVRFELDVGKHHKKGKNFRVEGWVFAPGLTIAAGEQAFDMYTAIDKVIEKLAEQLRRKKDKETHRRQGR